ncbi:MAG: hypothetical protein H0U69_02250 [Trueperaceae bacterium]|nr:hypothetical protein [Trueperaceae bacterium]
MPEPISSHEAWRRVLPEGAVVATDLVGVADGALAHLGDPEGESEALAHGALVMVPLMRHGALRLRGPDRIDFLNAQVSHDVRSLAVGCARDAMLLDHRGRPQADVTIVRREDELFVSVDDARVAHVRDALETHLVFDQVVIDDLTDALASLVVSGTDVAQRVDEALGAPGGRAGHALTHAASGAVVDVAFAGASALLHARARGGVPSLDLHVSARDLGPLVRALEAVGVRMVGEVALASARVVAGITTSAAEGVEALPQEAGLESRLSYRKGCYLGQEIMARIEARGSLRRGPARLALDGSPAAPDERAVVDASGKVVGRVGSAAWTPSRGWQALAVMRLDLEVGAVVRTLGVGAVHDGTLGDVRGGAPRG